VPNVPFARVIRNHLTGFSPAVRASLITAIDPLADAVGPIGFEGPTRDQAVAVARTLLELERAYNEVDDVERLGQAKLVPKAMLSAAGFIQFGYLRSQHLHTYTTVRHASPRFAVNLRIKAPLDPRNPWAAPFAGCDDAIQTFATAVSLVNQNAGLARHFPKEELQHWSKLIRHMETSARRGEWEATAAHNLARLANRLLRAANLRQFRAWNANSNWESALAPADVASFNGSPSLYELIDIFTRAAAVLK
jgi:hypothetical protein